MGRRDPKKMDKIKKAIAELLAYHNDKIKYIDGKPSPKNIALLVKEMYGFDITRQSVHKILQSGDYGRYVNTLNIEDDPKIMELKEALQVQEQIWKNEGVKPKDRTMAANSWRALHKQLIDYENSVANIEIKKREASRPIYMIKFFPPSVDVLCPKCGHQWFDIKSEEEKKDDMREHRRVEDEKSERGEKWKPFYRKDCKEQKQFDDFLESNDDEEVSKILAKKVEKKD